MSRTILRFLAGFVLLVGLFAIVAESTARQSGVIDQVNLIVDARHEVLANYVEEPDPNEMMEAAVRAMIDSLEDPYTVYLTLEDIEGFGKEIRGTFSGIGAEVISDEKRVRIVTPLDDSPAWQSGILPGDLILEIDGVDTYEMKLNDAVDRLTGEAGTVVLVKVRHNSGEEQEIPITRAVIKIQTVKGLFKDENLHHDFMLDPANKIAYIRLTKFSDLTTGNLIDALNDLKKLGAKGLILDVRYNPGGLLKAAVDVSDLFLKGGKTIVSTRGRTQPEKISTSTDSVLMPDIPLVVVANGSSASASEILAGALLDNGRAVFIGTRTFGKGSAQQIRPLRGGNGAIKVTSSYWYLPSGRNIHRREGDDVWGVDPADGYYVILTPKQQEKMIMTRRDHEIAGSLRSDETSQTVTPQWLKENLADPQLAAALQAILDYLDTGQWTAVSNGTTEDLVKEEKRENLLAIRAALQEALAENEADLAALDDAGIDDGGEDVAAVEVEKTEDEAAAEMIDTYEKGVENLLENDKPQRQQQGVPAP